MLLTTYSSVFTDLTPSEEQTAKEEWALVGAALERKSKSLDDDMAIAASLDRVREKHSTNSNLYRTYILWLSDIDPTWQDKKARLKKMNAYKGLKRLKSIGTPEQQKKSAAMFETQSALAEVKPTTDLVSLARKLQNRTTRVTAPEMKNFNKTGMLKPPSEVPREGPELTEDDKVHLLNLYISDHCRHLGFVLRTHLTATLSIDIRP